MDRLAMDRLAYQNMTTRGRGPYASRLDEEIPHENPYNTVNFTNELPSNRNIQVFQQSSPQGDQKSYFDHNNNHGGASLNSFSQPTGAVTSKSKMNTQINHYYLERQSKNS